MTSAGEPSALVTVWLYVMWPALLLCAGILFYIWNDLRRQVALRTHVGVPSTALLCFVVVCVLPTLQLLGRFDDLQETRPDTIDALCLVGFVATIVSAFALMYYSGTTRKSMFNTSEWNQLGGALAGIQQTVDILRDEEIERASSFAPPAATLDGTVIGNVGLSTPSWGRTIMADGSNAVFASVRIIAGQGVGTTFDVRTQGETRIGRSEAHNDITIGDSRVSAQHAKIRFEKGAFTVFDLGSGNGTFVNGVPVAGTAPIGNQDKLQVGDTAFIMQIASA